MSSSSPYAPPKSSLIGSNGLEILGYKDKYVIHQPSVEWPDRCYKCNDGATERKRVNLHYVNPWIYLSILITPIVTLVLALIFQKKFIVYVPFCSRHLQRRKHLLLIQWVAVVFMLGLIVTGGVTGSDLALGIGVIMVLMVILMTIALRIVSLVKFKNENLWLRGAGKSFVESLPVFKPGAK